MKSELSRTESLTKSEESRPIAPPRSSSTVEEKRVTRVLESKRESENKRDYQNLQEEKVEDRDSIYVNQLHPPTYANTSSNTSTEDYANTNTRKYICTVIHNVCNHDMFSVISVMINIILKEKNIISKK